MPDGWGFSLGPIFGDSLLKKVMGTTYAKAKGTLYLSRTLWFNDFIRDGLRPRHPTIPERKGASLSRDITIKTKPSWTWSLLFKPAWSHVTRHLFAGYIHENLHAAMCMHNESNLTIFDDKLGPASTIPGSAFL